MFRPLLAPLGAIALLAAARPVAAQRLAGGAPAATAAPVARPVATFRFDAGSDPRLPARVTLASAAGELVASYQARGDARTRPMTVAVLGTDLVLQGDTPSGVLTLRLEGQNDAAAGVPVTGRWWLGRETGALRGRPAR
jgi:hypothetical protein